MGLPWESDCWRGFRMGPAWFGGCFVLRALRASVARARRARAAPVRASPWVLARKKRILILIVFIWCAVFCAVFCAVKCAQVCRKCQSMRRLSAHQTAHQSAYQIAPQKMLKRRLSLGVAKTASRPYSVTARTMTARVRHLRIL